LVQRTLIPQAFPANMSVPAERKNHALFTRSASGRATLMLFAGQSQSRYLNGASDTPFAPSFLSVSVSLISTLILAHCALLSCSDLWAYLPGQDLATPGGSWARIGAGANGLVPPPMAQMSAVYDETADSLFVWGGVYEQFSGQDPANLLWQYSW
jgi:hypothetical protein